MNATTPARSDSNSDWSPNNGKISISLSGPALVTTHSDWNNDPYTGSNGRRDPEDGYLSPVISLRPAAAALVRTEPSKKLSVAIPRSLHKTLKQLALDDDETMGELITRLLQSALAQTQIDN